MDTAILDGFTLFVVPDVVGVVTELVEELVVVVVIVPVEMLVDVLDELVVVVTLTVVVVVVVGWLVGCGNGIIAMYILLWPFVMFSCVSHARYSVLFTIVALGTIVNAVV